MSVNPQHVVLFHHFRRFLEEAAREGVEVSRDLVELLALASPRGIRQARGNAVEALEIPLPVRIPPAEGLVERAAPALVLENRGLLDEALEIGVGERRARLRGHPRGRMDFGDDAEEA